MKKKKKFFYGPPENSREGEKKGELFFLKTFTAVFLPRKKEHKSKHLILFQFNPKNVEWSVISCKRATKEQRKIIQVTADCAHCRFIYKILPSETCGFLFYLPNNNTLHVLITDTISRPMLGSEGPRQHRMPWGEYPEFILPFQSSVR